MKNIVIIGGGTGTSTLLAGLKKYPAKLSVIVSTADDGGSNARIREDFGIIPPSDMRQCFVALSEASADLGNLFSYRFSRGELNGHTAGNLIFAAFSEMYASPDEAIRAVSKILEIKGQVIPVTLKPTVLSAVLAGGKKLIGEHNIDMPRRSKKQELRIKGLQLKPSGPANPKALQALKNADVIIFGPGDLHTSTIPNLLVKGVAAAINQSRAKKILVTNIMTKHGQTDGFEAGDFVKVLERYLKGKIDLVLVNKKKPAPAQLRDYKKHKAEFIEPAAGSFSRFGPKIIFADLLSPEVFITKPGDKLKRSFLRHDAGKLSKLIWRML